LDVEVVEMEEQEAKEQTASEAEERMNGRAIPAGT